MSNRPTDQLLADLLGESIENVEQTGQRLRNRLDDMLAEYPEPEEDQQ